MAVERAPYLNYTEITSYAEDIDNGSEIPLFIVKTDKSVAVSDIKSESVLKFISYNKFRQYFKISDNEDVYDAMDESIKKLDTLIKNFFVENSMYGENDEYGLSIPYIYIIDVGNNPTIAHYKKALSVSEVKRRSTAVCIPDVEDVNFMMEVGLKLKEETKFGLLRIAYFGISGQGKLSYKFAKGTVIKPAFDHHGYISAVDGYMKIDTSGTDPVIQGFYDNAEFTGNAITPSANYIYYDVSADKYYKYVSSAYTETTLASLEGYSEVVEGYKKDDDDTHFYTDVDKTNAMASLVETTLYLDQATKKSYTYNGSALLEVESVIGESEVLLYDSDDDYKFFIPSTRTHEMGGVGETFEQYCERCAFISQEIQSSRVDIVDKPILGKAIARICSTPYYIEPGYLPFMSVNTGVFDERSEDDRDALFATGLIFGEDDATLSITTPRLCLATSTAWGIEDHDMRATDALNHARRNADHHIRKILKIIAPQLKRNETSVTLRHVQNQVDLYLDDELSKGTIMEYSVKVYESSYNPYKLLVKGRLVTVNSTLAIEFENTIGSPYAIASDYV